jgi:hypothetical protein
MIKVAQNHEKRAKMGPNNVFGRLFRIMTKKCTKQTFLQQIQSNIHQGPFADNPGGTSHPLPPPKVAVPPCPPPLNRPMPGVCMAESEGSRAFDSVVPSDVVMVRSI